MSDKVKLRVDLTSKEDISNKSSSISTDTGSTTKYPTVKAVEDYVSLQVGEDYGTFTELQALIDDVPMYGTLTLDKDYKCQTGESQIYVSNISMFNGDGHIIDCNHITGIAFEGGTQLYNTKFINGHSEMNGGGIYCYNSVIINDCIFSNNIAESNGGALDFESDGSIITNCIFYKNRAYGNGGAIYSPSDGHIIRNCLFVENESNGGAIYLDQYDNSTRIEDCVFINGGVHSYTENFEIYNCVYNEDAIYNSFYNTTNVEYLKQHQSLKTINSQSLIGSGNIDVSPTIDSDWVNNSTNPVQSKVIKTALDNKLDKTHTSYKGKNVVTNASTGTIEFEDKNNHTHTKSQITDFPTIPSASSTTPSADTTSGSYGSGTSYARSNHTHPKSSLYAEASHTHSQYLTSHQDLTGKEDTSNKLTSLQPLDDLSTDTQYPSAKLVYNYWSDLNDTLQNNYPLSSDLGAVAFSNDYEDLDNLPSLGNLAFENDVDLSGHDLDELSDNTNLLFSGDYDDLDNKPTIPTQTSQLTNNSGFITSSSLSNYLQQSDVKDNLTSTDTNKPLSASQGKQLKALIDSKEDNIEIFTGSVDRVNSTNAFLKAYTPSSSIIGKIILYKVPNISSIEWATNVALDYYMNNQTSTFNRKYIYKNGVQLTFGDIESNSWILLAYEGTLTNGQWNLISSSSYVETKKLPTSTSDLNGDYLEDSNGSDIFNTFNGGYNYANGTITYTSSDDKVSYTHDYGMWEDSSGELANLNDLNKTYCPNFSENETIINKSFDYNWGVKFTYNKTNTINIDGYIQLGEDTDTCILVGVMENTSSIKLFDNLLGEVWDVILPNANSFDIRIWQVWNEDDLENNTGQVGETYRCTIYLYVNGNTSEFISSLAWTPSFNAKDLQRDVIYKVVQDTNSRITDLTFSTDGVYVEKADLNNNSTNLDSLLADMIDYGMDNDSKW